jgi:hypothetical protein
MDREKLCCASCVGDRGLRKEIVPIFSITTGACDYCGTENEHLIKPLDLRNYFEILTNIYSPSESGKTLVEWFKEDWAMFTHPAMDVAHAKELLSDILDDGDIVRSSFSPSSLCYTGRLDIWGKLKDELMHRNRFFPQTNINEDERLESLLDHLLLDPEEISDKWYRARIQDSKEPYPIEEMCAPPKRLASQGRANPAGIPYLYLASTPDTAVSEIRPHTGELVSVADFCLSKELKIIDLRNPKHTVSPFLLGDENEIALLRGDIEFLVYLGNELTRPVLPHAAAIDYIPSQYICEFIKKCGHQGVMYESAVGPGINIAIFDPSLATPGRVDTYYVSKVSVDVENSTI